MIVNQSTWNWNGRKLADIWVIKRKWMTQNHKFSDYLKLRHNNEMRWWLIMAMITLAIGIVGGTGQRKTRFAIAKSAPHIHSNNLSILIIFHLLDYIKWTKSRKKLHENYSHISKYLLNVYLSVYSGDVKVFDTVNGCPMLLAPFSV